MSTSLVSLATTSIAYRLWLLRHYAREHIGMRF